MGKAKRKINRLRRKKLQAKIGPRIPIAPPNIRMKSKKDYNRKNMKNELKKALENG